MNRMKRMNRKGSKEDTNRRGTKKKGERMRGKDR